MHTVICFKDKKSNKNEKIKLLIKIFDKPARKTAVLLGNLMLNNDWSLTFLSVQKKYKLYGTANLIKSLHSIGL